MAKDLRSRPLGLWEERVNELKAVLEHPNLSDRERLKTEVLLYEAQGIAAMVNKYDPLKVVERSEKLN